MTTITLPPDLEQSIIAAATLRGTTPEILAVESLARMYGTNANAVGDGGASQHFFDGYIGAVSGSSELVSEHTGRRFAELIAKDRQGAQP